MAEPLAPPARTAARAALDPGAELAAAIGFLTRIPVRRALVAGERTGAAAFGIVGAGIGLVAAVPLTVLGPLLPMPAAVLAVVVVEVVSGGLHVDGLADTADALAAPTPEAAERARTDPRAGAAGVAAVAMVLILDASLIAAIGASDAVLAAAVVVVAGAGSRGAAPLVAVLAGRLARTRGGRLGGWFAERVGLREAGLAALGVLAVAAGAGLLVGWAVPGGVALGGGIGAVVAAGLVRARGTLDGDGYGAIVEVVFAGMLLGAAILLAGR